MSPNAKRKQGRPPKYVADENSHPMIGLSAQPIRRKDGEILKYRYYATRSKPRVWFGFDYAEAVTRFRKWQSKQKGETVVIEEEPQPTTPYYREVFQSLLPDREPPESIAKKHKIPADLFAEKLNDMLSTRDGRRRLARLTGVKQFEYLNDLDVPARPLSLREIGELSCGKRDDDGTLRMGNDTNELRKSWGYWQEFCQAVKVTNIQEVTTDHLDAYRKFVKNLPGKNGNSINSRTIKNRYDRIGEILNHAFYRREQHQDVINQLRNRWRDIVRRKSPKVAKPIPTPIDPKDFAACLEVADVKWKAVLLLMLNCGLHPGECTGLHLGDIDLRKRWLWDHRNKNVEQRCSMLWDDTVAALRAYLKEYKPKGPYIFTNEADKRHPTGEFGKEFYREVRDPAGVERVTLDWLRDGGTDAASKRHVDSSKISMWSGRDRGEEMDKYDPRHPNKTQPVVDAVYAEYFG